MSDIKIPQLVRLVQLRRAGLSNSATAKVLRLDYGITITTHGVRKNTQRYAPELLSESHRRRKGAFGREVAS